MKRKMMFAAGAFLISISILNAQEINRSAATKKAKQAKEVAAADARKVEAIRKDVKHSDDFTKEQKDALNKDYKVARKRYTNSKQLAENNKGLLKAKYSKTEQEKISNTYNKGKDEYKSDKKALKKQKIMAEQSVKNGGNTRPGTQLNAKKIHKKDRKYYNTKKNKNESNTPPIVQDKDLVPPAEVE